MSIEGEGFSIGFDRADPIYTSSIEVQSYKLPYCPEQEVTGMIKFDGGKLMLEDWRAEQQQFTIVGGDKERTLKKRQKRKANKTN